MQMRSTASREPILSTFSQIFRFGSLAFDVEAGVALEIEVCAKAGEVAEMASAAMISGFSMVETPNAGGRQAMRFRIRPNFGASQSLLDGLVKSLAWLGSLRDGDIERYGQTLAGAERPSTVPHP